MFCKLIKIFKKRNVCINKLEALGIHQTQKTHEKLQKQKKTVGKLAIRILELVLNFLLEYSLFI